MELAEEEEEERVVRKAESLDGASVSVECRE